MMGSSLINICEEKSMKSRMCARIIILISSIALLFLNGCENRETPEPVVLKLASSKAAKETKKIWNDIARDFNKQMPNVSVQYFGMDDEHYESAGLASLLLYENPDLYFEWGGKRVEKRMNDGTAYDMTGELESGPWKSRFSNAAWDGAKVNGKIYMLPYFGQVSNVFWFNSSIFDKYQLKKPDSWEQFLTVCETLKKNGVTPIVIGNKDLWTGGNVMGHLVSRVVGEKEYHRSLARERTFYREDFLKAFKYIATIWNRGYVNSNVNGLSAADAVSEWIQGKGAIHPLGSWTIELVIDSGVKGFTYDFFNLPAIEGEKGDQTSVLGLNVGFIVNQKSKHKKEAIELLKFMTREDVISKFTSIGELPLVREAFKIDTPNPLTIKLGSLLDTTSTVVAPPDTGYDLKVADAFYSAIAQVLGGVKDPDSALQELDKRIQSIN